MQNINKNGWTCFIVFQAQLSLELTHSYFLSHTHTRHSKDLCYHFKHTFHLFFSLKRAGCWFSAVSLVSLLSLCWMYICMITFNDQEDINW